MAGCDEVRRCSHSHHFGKYANRSVKHLKLVVQRGVISFQATISRASFWMTCCIYCRHVSMSHVLRLVSHNQTRARYLSTKQYSKQSVQIIWLYTPVSDSPGSEHRQIANEPTVFNAQNNQLLLQMPMLLTSHELHETCNVQEQSKCKTQYDTNKPCKVATNLATSTISW